MDQGSGIVDQGYLGGIEIAWITDSHGFRDFTDSWLHDKSFEGDQVSWMVEKWKAKKWDCFLACGYWNHFERRVSVAEAYIVRECNNPQKIGTAVW